VNVTGIGVAGIDDIRAFSLPMRQRFRGQTQRTGLLLHGPAGWGEFSPFPEYGPAYASRWLRCAIAAATEPAPPAARTSIAVNTTVPAVDPATAHRLVAASGCSTAKVKVAEPGQDLAVDVERVAAVRDALGPGGHVRVDANAAWDVESAVLAIARLERAAGGLEYVEQPCRSLQELREVRRRVGVPLAADESVRTAQDPLRIAGLDAADVIVVKVQPLGGVRRALEVVEAAGLPAVVSSALESSVGLAVGLAFAAALPRLDHACGLGTATLFAADVTDDPLVPREGRLQLRTVEPQAAMLDQCAPDPDTTGELLERLQLADAHLHDA
jgi:o-succinylbenzoate synthase